ncbi:peptidase family m20 m25 m40 [Fusarium longipes]|uniref:Peptidase family m20 m25 m40 n=1 Tax=Fusarium longipes TaxID=694270 RepID=A0A395RL61_9HYPO|nr:peptidase family m20 m25 m40 [Fusarium longipes]
MANRESIMPHSGTLEALQSHQTPLRRSRPPNIDTMAAEENRVPLKAEKASRRESRLGLRSLFSRSKTPKDLAISETPTSYGSRISLADSNPYFSSQLDVTSNDMPSSPLSPRILSTMFESHQSSSAQPRSAGASKVQSPAKVTRGPLSTWHPPPLFKAFPQATKHITLPATSLAPEVILRMHERRTSTTRDEASEALEGDAAPIEKTKFKKKHRRNTSGPAPKFEWTNKIYVLVTAGYLLQYAAEGPFDRTPERILHLTKDSAAFASDVIPGRHWVVQVSSAAESDGTPGPDSRSLFSRWNFRATERRHASSLLMVFESAEDMEGWIATLRRTIETLGGKKTLTETGKPKAEDETAPLREKPSQRTLIVRDPNRLSRIATQNSQSPQSPESMPSPRFLPLQGRADTNHSATNATEHEPAADPPSDDISTTNSFVSHDGRQLDSLRENSNRLSFISSGQRTVVTSAGSSPESSPVVDKFPATGEHKMSLEASPFPPEPRPRPNAAAILDRRQSMQVLGPFVELQGGPTNLRPQSSYGPGAAQDTKTPTPNFSVPNSSNRRYSFAKNIAQEFGMAPQSGPLEVRSLGRRAPPTTLPVARPLSMVADQPSPMEEIHERPVTRHGDETRSTMPTSDDLASLPQIPYSYDMQSRRSSLAPIDEPVVEASRPTSSRRYTDVRQWRKSENPGAFPRNLANPSRTSLEQKTRSRSSLIGADEAARRRASLDAYSDRQSDSMSVKVRAQRRASVQSVMSDRASQYSASADLPPPMAPESLPLPAPPPTVPLPPIPTSASNPSLVPDTGRKNLIIRRSMPQLNEVPPPMPPPTCALPPIPPKLQVKA